MENEVVMVGLTGGQCSGKTTVLNVVPQKLESYGWPVYVCEEAATFLIGQGMKIKQAIRAGRRDLVREYEKEMLGFTFENESRMIRCAKREQGRALVLSDRPIPDIWTFLVLLEGRSGERVYIELLREVANLSPVEALDRYKGIIKLTTAADGAEEFYTLENNQARDETPEQARYFDKRSEEAYLAHQHLRVIDNSTDFAGKKLRALQEICHVLGIPAPLEVERKYLAQHPCFAHFPVPYRKVAIEQAYLLTNNPEEEVRIRRRTLGDGSTFYLTKKKAVRPGVRVETEEMISWREYLELMEAKDPRRGVIEKDRVCFLWQNQYFELDIFKNLDAALCLLEIELTDMQRSVILPPFLKVSEADEVTDNPRYKNQVLALRAKR